MKRLKKIKKNEGITLIALVVTIVILMILAGVSISMLGSNNGTITKTTEAKFKSEIAELKEKVELANIEINDGDGYIESSLEQTIGKTGKYDEILSIEYGKLVYDPDKINEQQEKWLNELEIYAKQGIGNLQVFADKNVTAQKGMEIIQYFLNRMKELTIDAGNETNDLELIQEEYKAVYQEICNVLNGTTAHTSTMLNGDFIESITINSNNITLDLTQINLDLLENIDKTNLSIAEAKIDTALQIIQNKLSNVNSVNQELAQLHIKGNCQISIDGISDIMIIVQTAEGQMNDQFSLLQRMNELAVRCNIDSSADVETINNEFTSLIQELNTIATTTTLDNRKLLDGSFNQKYTVNNIERNLIINDTRVQALGINLESISVENSETAMAQIMDAINNISKQRAKLGALQNNLDTYIYVLS